MIAQKSLTDQPDRVTSFGMIVSPADALEHATAVVSFLDVAMMALLSKDAPLEPNEEQAFGMSLVFGEVLYSMRAAKAAMQAPKPTAATEPHSPPAGTSCPSAKEIAAFLAETMGKGGEAYPRFDSGAEPDEQPQRAAKR